MKARSVLLKLIGPALMALFALTALASGWAVGGIGF